MRPAKLIIAVTLILVVLSVPKVNASPVTVTITPTSQVISQNGYASYAIALSAAMYNVPYTLSLSGLVSGASFNFNPNPAPVAGGSGSSTLTISTVTGALYCPGTYSFTVNARNSTSGGVGPVDTGTASGSVTVVLTGPPLSATVATDKPAYRIGDKVTITVAVNRPAEGLLTITPPSGSPSTFQFVTNGPTYSVVKTLTAGPAIGRYTVNLQADDFCSGFSSSVAYFDVTPDTYDVSLSLSGVPPQVSVGIQVDGQNQGTMQGTDIKQLSFKVDTSHTITMDQYVNGDPGTRYFATQNTWSVSSGGSHTFNYETQYQLTVTTDPDGVAQLTGGGWYSQGAQAQTSQAPDSLAGPPGTQYTFKGWEVDGVLQSGNPITVTMSGPRKAVAKYQVQYLLIIDSQGGYGNPQGGGYYDAGSTATFSVTSPSGLIIQQVLDHWEGDYSGTSPQGTINMEGPHTVHAIWKTDYTQLFILLAVIAAALIVALLLMRRRGASSQIVTKPPPAAPAGETPAEAPASEQSAEQAMDTVKCESCGADVPVSQTYCQNCGAKVG